MFNRTLVAGAGNWGTTFARLLASQGHDVTLHVWEEDVYEGLLQDRINHRYLPGIVLPETLSYIHDDKALAQNWDLLVLALPANTIRTWLATHQNCFRPDQPILNLSKGIEIESGKRLSQVIQSVFPLNPNIATISGPNIAREIAEGKPAIAAVASLYPEFNRKLQSYISCPTYRVYTNPDIIGIECCGSLKNIIAIGAGICHGLDLGDNAIAALITRGIMEISRYGLHFGANPLTFMGMAGVGDLTVTCMSPISRNNSLGRFLAQGKTLGEAQEQTRMVTEGVYTCQVVHPQAVADQIYMPITKAIHDILFQGISPRDAISELMEGSLKEEMESRL